MLKLKQAFYLSKTWLTVVVLLAITISAVAGSALARPSQQNPTVLRVGYIGDENSDLARGIRLAIEEVNGVGGITGPNGVTYAFEFRSAEVDADDPDSVTAAITTLSNEQVIAIFGPETNALTVPNISALSSAIVPVLTAATDDALLTGDANNNIFRLVAPESVYNTALANYMVTERGLRDMVLIQTDAAWNNSVTAFSTALNQLQAPPSQLIQVTDTAQLMENILTLPEQNPPAVVVFGPANDAVGVLSVLRDNNWGGVFAIRTDEGFSLDQPVLQGVLGVDSWTFGANDQLGRIFIGNYVAQYGAVPSAFSVAGYDAFYALSRVIGTGGPASTVVRQLLSQLSTQTLVRGPVDPAAYGNRSLSRTAYVYELTGQGGARGLLAYDNNIRRELGADNTSTDTSTPSATATPTLQPTFTPPPSATPSVVTGTVNNRTLNVRSGPGTEYGVLDQLREGQQVTVSGRNTDFQWLFIQYNGRVGWISAQYVDLFDPGGLVGALPLVQAPPTPTPGPTQRPAEADLVITGVVFSPSIPQPGVAATATVTIVNNGASNAGPFAVAATFLPGNIYSSQNLGGLASGQTVTTTLSVTFTQTGYVPDLGIVVDLNNEVPEGATGEGNNIYTFAYKVDRAVAVQAQTVLNSGLSINFAGANLDMTWTGSSFNMLGAAKIGMLSGQTYENAYYDQVPGVAVNASFGGPTPGMVFAFITDEGQYGFFRVDNVSGTDVTLTYRVYVP